MKKVNLVLIIIWCVIGSLILGLLVSGLFWGKLFRSGRQSPGSEELLAEHAYSLDGIDTVNLDLSSEQCTVVPVDAKEMTVKQFGSNLPEHRIVRLVRQGNTLLITTNDTFGFRFNFSVNEHSRVEVYLPKTFKDRFFVDLSSGSVDLNGAFELTDLSIDLSSGKISGNGEIKAENAVLELTSGQIHLRNGLIADYYSMDVSSGRIQVDEKITGSGEIEMTSGDVRLTGVEIADSLDVNVTSGKAEVQLSGDPGLNFHGERTSGRIETYFETDHDGHDGDTLTALVGGEPYKDLNVDLTSGTVRITKAG